MTITYTYQKGLYINMTNKCTNNCDFCVRQESDGIYGSDSLWLEREPTREEIFDSIMKRDLSAFDEIVFCGYGEPTCRLYDMLWVCKKLKESCSLPLRVNTNGQTSLMYEEDVTPLFKDLVDVVSISLNCANAEDYQKICHSKYGEQAYYGLLKFAKDVKRYVPRVVLSVVEETIPVQEIEQCRSIAQNLGVELRIRSFIE